MSAHSAYVHYAQTEHKCQKHIWRDYGALMETPATRLKAAREAANFASAREASIALGLKYETYAQHENGTRGYTSQSAEKYARRFRTTAEWLLFGKKDRLARDEAAAVLLPIALPSAALVEMFEGLFEVVGRPDLANEYASRLAQLLPSALTRALGGRSYLDDGAPGTLPEAMQPEKLDRPARQ